MKVEGSYPEGGAWGGGSTPPSRVVLSAEADSDAEALARFVGLIDAVGWEWLLGAMARRFEQKSLRP